MLDHDVLIVGGGPVGLLVACLLVQHGIDVSVCEQRADADPRTRAIGIHRPGLDALDAAGLGSSVREEALSLDGGDVISRGRTLASLDFTQDRPVLVLPQHRTDALLRARLERVGPDVLERGHLVSDVCDEGNLVRIATESAHGVREVTASIAIVADGIRSPIRNDLGIGWRRRRGAGEYAMIDLADASAGARAALYCEPAGLVESFPLPAGRRRWVVRAGSTGIDGIATAAGFADAVEERTGATIMLDDGDVPSVFTAAQHMAHRFARGRVALLGDAAHEVSPIGGQGMNLGWLDAQRLTAAIVAALPEPMPDLAGWDRRARRSARAAHKRSAFYMSMGAPARPPIVQAREVLIRALGVGPLRRRAAGLITMHGI